MLQDIGPKHLFNEYQPQTSVDSEDYIISLVGDEVLCNLQEQLSFPRYKEIENRFAAEKLTYLFSIDEARYFLHQGEKITIEETFINKTSPGKTSIDETHAGESILDNGFSYVSFTDIRGHIVKPRHEQYALYTARHLRDWYRDNKFCGRCGKPMHHSDTERCMVCECGYHSYPRIMPAVIVGVTNGDKLLLTKYRTGYNHNALVAGFVEIGETIEECVAREVMEEAGLKVKNIRYYKSQPWGIANDILVGYYCDVDGDDTITMDEGELKYAAWVDKEHIELQPDDISLTNEMMKVFKNS